MLPYIDYWDDVIAKWPHGGGTIPPSEDPWFYNGCGLHRELIPEPYWGNPEDCSVVLLNYNPGGPAKATPTDKGHISHAVNNDPNQMAGVMHSGYSNIGLTFPWLDEPSAVGFTYQPNHQDTKKWMRRRNKWVTQVMSGNLKPNHKPFFFDICGWLSHKWNLKKITPAIKNYINTHIKPVLVDSIVCSDLGIGLCIGKKLGDALIHMGFEDVTSCAVLGNATSSDGWQPNLAKCRWYRVYALPFDGLYYACGNNASKNYNKKFVYIINTWSQGSNGNPSTCFKCCEDYLIYNIKKYMP